MFDGVNFPKAPVGHQPLQKFISMFMLQMKHTGCDQYIHPVKDQRISKPSRSDKKERKRYDKDVCWIARSLQQVLVSHNEAFSLIKEEDNGVKAWDILMKRYDRRVFNENSSRAYDLHKLLEVTLTSTRVGAFNTFISKFDDIASYVKMDGEPLSRQSKHDLLLLAIKHKAYDVFLTNAKTRYPPYEYEDFVYALQVYSSEIEGKDSTPHHNDTRSVAYVSKINGYAVNDNGLTSKKN